MSTNDAIRRAIDHAGSQGKLALRTGEFSQAAISKAVKLGRVSARMAVAIERATGGAVSRVELCPDIFDGLAPTRGTEAAE